MSKDTRKLYKISELAKLANRSKHTIYMHIQSGTFGVVTKERPGSYRIDPQKVEEYCKKSKKKKEKHPMKDFIHIQKYTKEEAAQKAQEIVDKYPDMTNEQKKEQFGRFFRTYLKTHDFIPKEKPLSPEQKTDILTLPLDLITLISQEFNQDEAEFFVNQYLGYMDAGYDKATPTQRFLIRILIEQQLRARRFTRLTRMTKDYRDPDLEKTLDEILKRILDIATALGETLKRGQLFEGDGEKDEDRSEAEMRSDLRKIK